MVGNEGQDPVGVERGQEAGHVAELATEAAPPKVGLMRIRELLPDWWRRLGVMWGTAIATLTVVFAYLSLAYQVGWTPFSADPEVLIDVAASRINSEGVDLPSDEYICLVNDGSDDVSLAGWVLRNAHSDVNKLPAFSLAAGAGVRIYPGVGEDSATDLHGDDAAPRWNNAGGVISLLDADGRIVDAQSYGPATEDAVAAGPCGLE